MERKVIRGEVRLSLKLSNKATLSLRSLSKCSFTPSKLRFFELRKPKISSCYTTSKNIECANLTCWIPAYWFVYSIQKIWGIGNCWYYF